MDIPEAVKMGRQLYMQVLEAIVLDRMWVYDMIAKQRKLSQERANARRQEG